MPPPFQIALRVSDCDEICSPDRVVSATAGCVCPDRSRTGARCQRRFCTHGPGPLTILCVDDSGLVAICTSEFADSVVLDKVHLHDLQPCACHDRGTARLTSQGTCVCRSGYHGRLCEQVTQVIEVVGGGTEHTGWKIMARPYHRQEWNFGVLSAWVALTMMVILGPIIGIKVCFANPFALWRPTFDVSPREQLRNRRRRLRRLRRRAMSERQSETRSDPRGSTNLDIQATTRCLEDLPPPSIPPPRDDTLTSLASVPIGDHYGPSSCPRSFTPAPPYDRAVTETPPPSYHQALLRMHPFHYC